MQVDQNIFDGGKTRNSVGQAESQVLGARATLRNTEQNVLLDAATSYMKRAAGHRDPDAQPQQRRGA